MRASAAFLVAVTLAAALSTSLPSAEAHGFMSAPRSRNFVAYEDGKWWSPDPTATFPAPEACPHCMNRWSVGACGVSQTDSSRDYSKPKDFSGNPLTPKIQSTLIEGQTVEVEFVLTAHHKGHIEMKVCEDWENPTQACFDAHPLTFIADVSSYDTKANVDVAYPIRGHVHPKVGNVGENSDATMPTGGGMHFKMQYKLPEGFACAHCLLQWRYITGNSCEMEGYDGYDWPTPAWHKPDLSTCPNPLPKTGAPEQFWNCADVAITPADGSPAPAPQPSPPAVPAPQPTPEPTPEPAPSPGVPEVTCTVANAPMPSASCDGFYSCDAGKQNLGFSACPSGLLFDASLSICNRPSLVQCAGKGTPPKEEPPAPTPTPAPVPKEGEEGERTVCSVGKAAMVPLSHCRAFVHCRQVGDTWEQVGSLVPCPFNLLFDADAKACNWATQVKCKGVEL